MQQNFVSPSYAAAELRAREQWASHDFGEAAVSARGAAEIAENDGDLESWWNMTFFQAESLLAAGQFEACAEVAEALIRKPFPAGLQLQARVRILLSKAWQGAGLLERAADEARSAAELMTGEADIEINVTARLALIAALGESGRLDEAWEESLHLAQVISVEVDDQLLGKAYWAIGNAAFLSSRVDAGLEYHELAAATFSPARNLDVWAKFNNASAAMRLAADVADAATLRCIERAELATDVIGGSAENALLLKLNRGHWNYLAGDPAAAVELLDGLCNNDDILPPQTMGESCLLLGRAYKALGDAPAAERHLLEAAEHFDRAGAQQRADLARGFLAAED
jgi:tetratricopeptide (TPR) repeat protein